MPLIFVRFSDTLEKFSVLYVNIISTTNVYDPKRKLEN